MKFPSTDFATPRQCEWAWNWCELYKPEKPVEGAGGGGGMEGGHENRSTKPFIAFIHRDAFESHRTSSSVLMEIFPLLSVSICGCILYTIVKLLIATSVYIIYNIHIYWATHTLRDHRRYCIVYNKWMNIHLHVSIRNKIWKICMHYIYWLCTVYHYIASDGEEEEEKRAETGGSKTTTMATFTCHHRTSWMCWRCADDRPYCDDIALFLLSFSDDFAGFVHSHRRRRRCYHSIHFFVLHNLNSLARMFRRWLLQFKSAMGIFFPFLKKVKTFSTFAHWNGNFFAFSQR